MDPDTHIVIVGAGFAGLGMAIALRKAGVDSFTILERGDDVGGTWRDNHYPGCACDVPSHLYSYSFAPNPTWTRMFAPQAEILAYTERVVREHDLRRHIRFGADVVGARFDEGAGRWTLELRDGDTVQARAAILGVGPLSRPKLPDVPGLDRFEGDLFHSARWDHDVDLDGKSVAVIGTGASAIQFVPQVAPRVGSLTLFQRTPPWIMPRPDRAISPAERALYARLPITQWLYRQLIYWRSELLCTALVYQPRILPLAEKVARAHLEAQVADPELRAKLTPGYRIGCKRVLLANDYYPALCRDNVRVVTAAITGVDERAVLTADGERHEVDAILLGTGFHAADDMAPFEVVGRDGRRLKEAWRTDAEAYRGTVVSGFPNLFFLVGPNTGLGHSSMIFMIECQVRYVSLCLRAMRERGLRSLEVRPEVQARYNASLQRRMSRTVWSTGGCASWYQSSSGRNTTLYPGFTFAFRRETGRLRLEEFDVVPAASAAPSRGGERATATAPRPA